ncbi:hypothetical protein PAPYR_5810 [Paratrimastix pyriformis]|uniref:Uncharacterized protein n=1 Tax=Paratrimastix pyriformis TaxID=342808 RepID=A0ABQ8UJ25_9EUKA|nr:hypothetical protein PAPYR_5810 [Paratrimastix pyriformis]
MELMEPTAREFVELLRKLQLTGKIPVDSLASLIEVCSLGDDALEGVATMETNHPGLLSSTYSIDRKTAFFLAVWLWKRFPGSKHRRRFPTPRPVPVGGLADQPWPYVGLLDDPFFPPPRDEPHLFERVTAGEVMQLLRCPGANPAVALKRPGGGDQMLTPDFLDHCIYAPERPITIFRPILMSPFAPATAMATDTTNTNATTTGTAMATAPPPICRPLPIGKRFSPTADEHENAYVLGEASTDLARLRSKTGRLADSLEALVKHLNAHSAAPTAPPPAPSYPTLPPILAMRKLTSRGTPSPPLGTPSPPLGSPSPPLGSPSPPLGSPPLGTSRAAPSPPLGNPSPPLGNPSPPLGNPSPPLGNPSPPLGSPPLGTSGAAPSPPLATPPSPFMQLRPRFSPNQFSCTSPLSSSSRPSSSPAPAGKRLNWARGCPPTGLEEVPLHPGIALAFVAFPSPGDVEEDAVRTEFDELAKEAGLGQYLAKDRLFVFFPRNFPRPPSAH